MIVRNADLSDAEAIRTIYNHEVTTTTATFDLEPRSIADQRAWLSERSGVHSVLVAVDDGADPGSGERGAVMGFASLSPYKERAAYRTSVEDSVYVSADYRGRGVGRVLLQAIVDQAAEHGFHTVIARIGGGEENQGSIAVHRAVGFELIGIERQVGRKFGQWVDVVSMQRML